MTSAAQTKQQVRHRAQDRCEYCLARQLLQIGSFHIEHVIPTSLNGPTTLENLALACPDCNFRKSNRVEVPDPTNGEKVSLFRPRDHVWSDHFSWNGFQIEGASAIGRATIAALDLNSERRLLLREVEALLGLFPPSAAL